MLQATTGPRPWNAGNFGGTFILHEETPQNIARFQFVMNSPAGKDDADANKLVMPDKEKSDVAALSLLVKPTVEDHVCLYVHT